MKIIKRRLNFYSNICNNIEKGIGHVYKLKINIDIKKFYEKITSANTDLNKLDNKNETYAGFLYFAKSVKNFNSIEKEQLNKFLVNLFLADVQLLPLIFIDKDQNIIFYNINEKMEIPSIFAKFKDLISTLIDCKMEISNYDNHLLCSIIKERLADVENFFVVENGEFINNLFNNFPDEISKKSFETYIEQRILVNIQCDYKVVYPVRPPKITQKWRNERLSTLYNLPTIKGTISDQQKEWFYETTFKLEQYAINGICEAEKGDVVIDAGAFVGDTALYFAQKIGDSGKIYAFEPIEKILSFTKQNIKENGIDHIVEVIPKALSNINRTLHFIDDTSDSSAINLEDIEDNYNIQFAKSGKNLLMHAIDAVSLDSFVEERKIRKVDFLKADLEGADVDFVKGALKTISRDAPKCGLTVYHKKEDFITIPKLLMSAQDDYVFYFRCETEPVIFAKRKE